MEYVVLVLAVLMVLLAVLAVMVVPNGVVYAESITVEAPVAVVYDAIRHQTDLMQWSAWPSATNSTCSVAGPDGEVGAQTVFFSKGKRFGHQEVTALSLNREVVLGLQTAGPPQRPILSFKLEAVGPNRTRVDLHFVNIIARPFNVLLRVFGVVRWTRNMHRKDLQGLKRYVEPPHLTYAGKPARVGAP